ncbi:MAG: hypothetical protein IKA02_04815 [Clostridia bacterium]|nr:hypothetical protein [Clostridia bacterium]
MIFYLIGGMILVTFIASVIHYFAQDSDLSSFFIEDGGWVTVAICLILGFSVIGCVYGNVGLSILIALTLLIPLISCVVHYVSECCSDLNEFFVDCNGWVTLVISAAIPLTVCGSIFVNTLWSLTIGCTVIFGLVFASIHYCAVCCSDLEDFIKDECGWIYPLLCVSISSTVVCAIYFNTTISLIIGITVTVMIIASIIHYCSSYSSGFFEFFSDDFGWLTNGIILTIGLTVLGCVCGDVGKTVYWAAAIIITAISCAIHVDSCCSCDFEDFFVEDKGWLNVSICALISFTLYGFIFWNASKTFIVMTSFILLVIALAIHYAKSNSYDLENFLYDNNGLLTLSIIVTLGYSVFAFSFMEFWYALITVLTLVASIICAIISKNIIDETYFITYFAVKRGALYNYLPLFIGGLLTGIIWSKWWFLALSTVVYGIAYVIFYIKARRNRTLYFPKKHVFTYTPTPKPTATPTPKPTPKTTVTPTVTPKVTDDTSKTKKTTNVEEKNATLTVETVPVIKTQNKKVGELVIDDEG